MGAIIEHYRDHQATHNKLYIRQAKKAEIPNWSLKIETYDERGGTKNENKITPSVMKSGESRIITQAPAPGPRGATSDSIVSVGYEAKPLHKIGGIKMEQHFTSPLNDTEQQVGCLMVNDAKEATRVDNHDNNSQAPLRLR